MIVFITYDENKLVFSVYYIDLQFSPLDFSIEKISLKCCVMAEFRKK
jgi:hypothetical protein